MKFSLLTLAATTSVGLAAFSADFTNSTADTSATTPSTATAGVTTAGNLNAGTSGATWNTPITTSAANNSVVLVSNGARTGLSGNWLMMGITPNDLTHKSVATLNLTSAEAVAGTTISMDFLLMDAGGQDGGILISGYTAGGDAIFQAVVGAGGNWGQRDLRTLVTKDSFSGLVGGDNNIWTPGGPAVNLSFNLGSTGYTITGNSAAGSPFSVPGSYINNTGDLAVLEFKALGSKASAGIDNIIADPATPIKMTAASPQSFDSFGANETYSVDFSNTGIDGGQTLNITSVALSGWDAELFTTPTTWTTAVAANGGIGTINLPFAPGVNPAEGLRNVTLTITSNAPNSPTVIDVEVNLQYDVLLEAGSSQYFKTKGISETFSVDFSNIGTDGGQTLDITSVTLSGPDAAFFTAPTVWDAAVAAKGGTGTIDLPFDPGFSPTDRFYLVTLAVHSNALNSPTTINVDVETVSPFAVVSPAKLDFGEFNLPPSPQNLPLTVSNDGLTDLTISDAQIMNDANGVFSISGGYPIVVPAGGSSDLTLTFTPNGSEGPWFTAEISVTTDGENQSVFTVPAKLWFALSNPDPVASINLGAKGQAVTLLGGAGVVNDVTWENVFDGAAESVNNVDRSSIDLSWLGHNTWTTAANASTAGGQMMKGRWDSGGLSGDVMTISDINATYSNYDVIVYYAFNQGNSFVLTVGGQSVFVNQGGQAATAGPGELGLDNYLTNGPSDGVNPSHWHRFTGLTADSFSINVSSLIGRAGFTGIQIVKSAPGISFADWISGYPGVGGQTGFAKDPDGDGNDNGVEAFFGTDPSVASVGINQVVTNGSTITTFKHPQADPQLSDVIGSYQWSLDLVTWYAGDGVDGPVGGPTVLIPTVSPVGGIASVTATASETVDALFIRVQAAN